MEHVHTSSGVALSEEAMAATRRSQLAHALIYSHRSAVTGSTSEAVMAGTPHAAMAVATMPTSATANELPSVGCTSYRRLASIRVIPTAESAPSATPAAVIPMPCLMTMISTARLVAPSAIRTP